MKVINKKIMSVVMILILLLTNPCNVMAMNVSSLTSSQQKNAKIIAEITAKNWSKYGVLPSIAVAQAIQETSLGKAYNNGNLWGIKSGHVSYPSVADGTYAYMRVINNGYYDKALFQTDYKKQIRYILDGGYCVPEGEYYSNILWIVDRYNLDELDRQMFEDIEKQKEEARKLAEKKKKEKERKERERKERERQRKLEEAALKERQKKWKSYYTMMYDESVPDNSVVVNGDYIEKGTIRIYDKNHMVLQGIYDVQTGSSGFIIKTSNKKLHGMIVTLDVLENAKG